MPSPIASIDLLIKKGRNLKPRVKGVASNPSVTATLGTQVVQTRVVKNDPNPVWEEVLTLEVSDAKQKSFELRITNNAGDNRNQFGRATVELRYLQKGEQDMTISLPMNGELQLTIDYKPTTGSNGLLNGNGNMSRLDLAEGSSSHDLEAGFLAGICDNSPVANHKLEELFMEWLTLPTTEHATQSILQQAKGGERIDFECLGPRRLTPTSLPRAPKLMTRRRSAPPLMSHTTTRSSRLSIGFATMPRKRFSEPVLSKRSRSSHGATFLTKDDLSDFRSLQSSQKKDESSLDGIMASLDLESRDTKGPTNLPSVKEEDKPKEVVPQFYFPTKKPKQDLEAELRISQKWKEVTTDDSEDAGMDYEDFKSNIKDLCGLPQCIIKILWSRVVDDDTVSLSRFLAFFRKEISGLDSDEGVFNILKQPGSRYIFSEDIEPAVQEIVDNHPGLEFLQGETVFQEAYVKTVRLRIMYMLAGLQPKISLRAFQASNLVQTMHRLDTENDINQVTDFFSYNHFYVIWCLFWELDQDEDTFLSKADILRYAQYSLSDRIVDRIMGMRRDKENTKSDMMSYPDFVYFLLSEEDKRTDSSLEYWFACVDMDADGVINPSDMQWFYEEQERRLDKMGEEVITFAEMLNEFHDMIHPVVKNNFSRQDMAKCGLAANVFDALFNVKKLLAWEELGSEKAAGRVHYVRNFKDWDLFASREYTRLAEDDEDGD